MNVLTNINVINSAITANVLESLNGSHHVVIYEEDV